MTLYGNFVYDNARAIFLSSGTTVGTNVQTSIDWLNDNIKMMLVYTGVGHYVPNQATDQYLTAIAPGDRVQASPNLTGKTNTAGVANSNQVTFAAVPTGSPLQALVVYKDTGSAATSPLIAFIDTMTGLPVTPNGGDLIFVPDSGGNHIFKL